ncbi:aminomethyl-transferring glycine dehydrogenase subunit GcvPA [Vampirovibrio sp.]|uniref:aminomethyl-transferring glycine dehydrogenase subunit GcvPA n=1 Tax=Vampirovibrio sp. TaxID=2717857 RepID=UPI003593DDAF
MYNFLPHTEAERQLMLEKIGVHRIEDLFSDIPGQLRENIHYTTLPQQGLTEIELQQELAELARLNPGASMACFLGGGAYNRFIPMAVNTIASRSEFYTAYTPYQPEIAQGTLQVTYEFQTMICELTGMDVANASVYDGASAVTEAAFMAMRATRRTRILIANSVHPDYRQVLKTYAEGLGDVTLVTFDPMKPGELLNSTHPEASKTACVIIQVPNYFGGLEETETIRQFCEASGAFFIVSAEPVSMGLLKPPGQYGADIVTGDIQPLGNHLSFGGPYGGYIATKNRHVRQLPGRLVGKTVDKNGKQCYTLTLQTREQHIRREKATSNICTNQALNVLKATVYMALVGPNGLKHLANLSVQRTHALASRLKKLPGVSLYVSGQPFLFEVALRFPIPVKPLLASLEQQGILGGIELERFYPDAKNCLLITCTEMTSPAEIERYIQCVEAHFKQMEPLGPGKPKDYLEQMEATC